MADHEARAAVDGAEEENNKTVVTALYKALAKNDVETVHRLLAPDLEWWFHGPAVHQHLMRMLTGSSPSSNPFAFQPLLSIVAVGSMVLVEGFNEDWDVSWVHAWTVTHGIITQVREYFNTFVTVTRFGDGGGSSAISTTVAAAAATTAALESRSKTCQSVWQSRLCDNKSVPGLVLAL